MSYRNPNKDDKGNERRRIREERRERILTHNRNDRVIRDTLEELASDNFNRDAEIGRASCRERV